jgi:hypothetical protein
MTHRAVQIGTHDSEGRRTFSTPGDVCDTCSDFERGLLVPVTECPKSLTDYYRVTPWADREFDEHTDRAHRQTRAYRMPS